VKVLIVQIGRIGDMVLVTPLFGALARLVPGVRIHVLCSRHNLAVIDTDPRLAAVHVFRKNPAAWLRLIWRLRRERFDLWIDPKDHHSGESKLFARLGGAARKIGFNRPTESVFDVTVPGSEENLELHAVQRNLQALRSLGYAGRAPVRPELFVDRQTCAQVADPLGGDLSHHVVAHVSAGSESRYWQPDGWRQVIQACQGAGRPVILTCSPDDAATARQLVAACPGAVLFRSHSIREVIALVSQVGAVVTADTSVVHIASAFNIPQVALFPRIKWNFRKFRPLSDGSATVQPGEGESLRDIPAVAVIEKLLPLLASPSSTEQRL